MAPSHMMGSLLARQIEYCDGYDCYSSWNNWGRWVALVAIVFSIFLLTLACSCLNARRRRRRGIQPMYGTGWMATKPPGGNQPGYYHQGQFYGTAAPPYTAQPVGFQQTGNTFNSNDGYYGQNAYELQPPQHTYQPQPQREVDGVYSAPDGPPPSKK